MRLLVGGRRLVAAAAAVRLVMLAALVSVARCWRLVRRALVALVIGGISGSRLVVRLVRGRMGGIGRGSHGLVSRGAVCRLVWLVLV